MTGSIDILIIGGSAGSVQVISKIIHGLSSSVQVPIVVVLHRLRNVSSEMNKILSAHTGKKIVEPDDKEPIREHYIYLAPQNYHLLIERDLTFSLDYSEVVQYSRPSIDVTMESAARVYGESVFAILLSGANKDGSNGVAEVIARGGRAIVQDPESAAYPAMPLAALNRNEGIQVLNPDGIIAFLNTNLKATP